MQIQNHSDDLFPYQQSFCRYLMEEEVVSYETLLDYQKILMNFFMDLGKISQLFARNQKITQVTAEDLTVYFQDVRDTYSQSRFNKIHTVITRYYKFLIIHRIEVPPFPWIIKTEQIRKNFELPEYDWEELSQMVMTIDIKDATSPSNEWINLMSKVIFILFSKGFTISQIASPEIKEMLHEINFEPQEKKYIDKASLVDSQYLVCKRDGNVYGKTQILLFLNELLKTLGMKEKKGRLTEDARVNYILWQELSNRQIAHFYQLKVGGQIVERLRHLAESRMIRDEKEEKITQ